MDWLILLAIAFVAFVALAPQRVIHMWLMAGWGLAALAILIPVAHWIAS